MLVSFKHSVEELNGRVLFCFGFSSVAFNNKRTKPQVTEKLANAIHDDREFKGT